MSSNEFELILDTVPLEPHLQPFFVLVILELVSSFLPKPAWTMILLFYSSCHVWDNRWASPCSAFSFEMDISQTFSWADLEP
jgi:hypothetical protein